MSNGVHHVTVKFHKEPLERLIASVERSQEAISAVSQTLRAGLDALDQLVEDLRALVSEKGIAVEQATEWKENA